MVLAGRDCQSHTLPICSTADHVRMVALVADDRDLRRDLGLRRRHVLVRQCRAESRCQLVARVAAAVGLRRHPVLLPGPGETNGAAGDQAVASRSAGRHQPEHGIGGRGPSSGDASAPSRIEQVVRNCAAANCSSNCAHSTTWQSTSLTSRPNRRRSPSSIGWPPRSTQGDADACEPWRRRKADAAHGAPHDARGRRLWPVLALLSLLVYLLFGRGSAATRIDLPGPAGHHGHAGRRRSWSLRWPTCRAAGLSLRAIAGWKQPDFRGPSGSGTGQRWTSPADSADAEEQESRRTE